jgi:hypothetical protein
MNARFSKNQLALAVAAAIGTVAVATTPTVATAAKPPGKYVAGDIHNHTTCSDGSTSMQKLVKFSMDRTATVPWGLDWFVQAGHGGNDPDNCTLVEDATLGTPAYPFIAGQNQNTDWVPSGKTVKGGGANGSGTSQGAGSTVMWKWQALQEFQYPVLEYLNALQNRPLFLGLESVVAGHEHTSMGVATGQVPASIDTAPLPAAPPYVPLGNANAHAQWSYCFDRGDNDLSRGNTTLTSGVGNNWECSVPGSLNAADPGWNATGMKLNSNNGLAGHLKTVEGVKWMAAFHPNLSYYIPTHLERAGPFNPNGANGFNIEHLRNFNNAGPRVAFGFETQPGHGASENRGEYRPLRNGGFPGGVTLDSVGGTTFGGTGVYGAVVGGVWDALLGEGRNYWFFSSSDWHSRGTFAAEDRRSNNDFFPGEYQRSYSMVRNGTDNKLRPQAIIDGMRSGNVWTDSGQLLDRFAFVACASYPGIGKRTNAAVEAIAVAAATNNTDTDLAGCATMGEKLKVRPGAEIVVTVVVRDPAGNSFSPYTFPNPSLLQVGINQPLNSPALDHIDLIRGMVTGYKDPNNLAEYAGEWPRNTAWLGTDGSTPPDLSGVPPAAKNTSAAIIKTFNSTGWVPVVSGVDGTTFLKMTHRIAPVSASQYVRARGTNLPPSLPFETDASGNPLSDLFTNSGDPTKLRIPCTTAHSASSQFDGCPDHLPTVTLNGVPTKAVAVDIAAWSDLWVYANPIYIEVEGSTPVAGVQ